jgi:ATP-dependent RNA helicase RhlE
VNFELFPLDKLVRAGIQAAGYKTPTPIQQQTIPAILAGHDLVGIAQTGTGKTAAFIVPILQRLVAHTGRNVRTLVLAPTRELAEQINEVTTELGQYTRVRSVTVYGGVSKKSQVNTLRRGVDIVVACPGRLLDLAGEGSIDLSRIEMLVLDEADRLFDMGFLPDIRRIIKMLPRKRQSLLFSATMPDEIRRLADSILSDPVTVQIGEISPAETISHALYPVTSNMKKQLLLAMLQKKATGRVLIFTRTKRKASYLARDLHKQGYRVEALQGNMTQNRRQRALDGFRNHKYDILVATDVASRGIDVVDINHVINYDMPDTADAYTHRVGRTGRAHHRGEAFTLAQPEDEAMVHEIERVIGGRLERRRLPAFNYGSFDPESHPKSNRAGQNGHRQSKKNGGAANKNHRQRNSARQAGKRRRTR